MYRDMVTYVACIGFGICVFGAIFWWLKRTRFDSFGKVLHPREEKKMILRSSGTRASPRIAHSQGRWGFWALRGNPSKS